MAATATHGAVCFPRRVAELLRAGLDLRDRHAAGEISRHGSAVARGRLENQLSALVFPPKANAANERLAQHLWAHRDDLFTYLRQPGLDATNWRAELAIRFGVILRKVWGGSRTWAGARAQSVLMSVWRTCWQQGHCALDFLSQFLRGGPVTLALPLDPPGAKPRDQKDSFTIAFADRMRQSNAPAGGRDVYRGRVRLSSRAQLRPMFLRGPPSVRPVFCKEHNHEDP